MSMFLRVAGPDAARRAWSRAHGLRSVGEEASLEVFAVDMPCDRGALWTTALEVGIDVVGTDPARLPSGPGTLFLDVDSTLILEEGIDRLAARAGVGPAVRSLTDAAMAGTLDYESSLRQRLRHLRGLDRAQVEEVAAGLRLRPGATEAVRSLREEGWDVVLLSGGLEPLVEVLRVAVGASTALANRPAWQGERLSGELDGPVVDAGAKARAVAELRRPGRVAVGIGDGANDRLFLGGVDLALGMLPRPVLLPFLDGVLGRGRFDALPPLLAPLRD